MVSFILLQIFKCIALKLEKKINEGECFWCHICPPWKNELELRNCNLDLFSVVLSEVGHAYKKPVIVFPL